jgi:hypothetical protein
LTLTTRNDCTADSGLALEASKRRLIDMDESVLFKLTLR